MKGISVHLRLVTFLCLAVAAVRLEAGSVVTTYGAFYEYYGPVGAPIYKTSNGPQRDPAAFVNKFHDPWLGKHVEVPDPNIVIDPHEGYESPEFAGAGVALVGLNDFGRTVEFWSAIRTATIDVDEGMRNILTITGTVTQDVAIDSSTSKSDLFKLATISFANGSWFSISDSLSPPYNPGNGPLYPESLFEFRLDAMPVPMIGNGTLADRHVIYDAIVLESTFGDGTPDYFYIRSNPLLGRLSVPEGGTGTVDLWGRIGSLELVEFRNPQGDGVTLLPPIGTPAIPAPPTLWLLGTGLLATTGVLRRRSRSPKTSARTSTLDAPSEK